MINMKKKLIVDILMFILMLLEFQRGYINTLYHEIFGIALLILVIIHLILNINFIKNLFKGKYNLKRIIILIINIGFLITFTLSMIFGILSSQDLLKFLSINSLKIIKLHKICSYITLIFMGLHLGINFNTMFGKINSHIKNKIIIYIIDIVIFLYGIYSFIDLKILKHITGTYGFSLYNKNIFINILQYLSIVMTISIIVNKINNLRKVDKNER